MSLGNSSSVNINRATAQKAEGSMDTVFSCKAHVEDQIQQLADAGTLTIGRIGQWQTSGEPVHVDGRYRSRSSYPGLMGTPIRWHTEGMTQGFFSKGLAYVNPRTVPANTLERLPIAK